MGGIDDHWKYLKVNFFIVWKELVEYKSNLVSAVIAQVFFLAAYFTFFGVFASQFGDVVGWNKWDFLLYFLFSDTILMFGGIWISKSIEDSLRKGTFNLVLLRPLRISFAYIAHDLNSPVLLMIIINSLLIVPLLIYMKIGLINLIIASFVGVLIFLLYFLLNLGFMSIDFVKIGLGDELRGIIVRQVPSILENYPFPFFLKSKIKYFLLFFPIAYMGSLFIPVIRDKGIWALKLQLGVIFSLIVIFILLIMALWRYGLKNYEAYG